MPVKNETSTRLLDEIRMISPWFFVLASIGFAMTVAAMVFLFATKTKPLPLPVPVIVLGGLLAAVVMACYFLLIGYVNFDAGRRGMSRLAWTLLAIFIPHALGIVLYFVLRSPRRLSCPQCGVVVEPGFGFCPGCRHRLNAVCPKCQRGVSASDKFCPYCGGELGIGIGAVPAPAQS